MMKVYQPVCPDMKFRLVADLSPDAVDVSEDSALSSDSASCLSDDDDIKVLDRTQASSPHPPPSRYACNRFSPGSASAATSFLAAGGRQNCHHGSVTVSEGASLMSELSSAQSSGAMGYGNGHVQCGDCGDGCSNRVSPHSHYPAHSISRSTPQVDRMVQYSRSAQNVNGENSSQINNGAKSSPYSMQQPVHVYDKVFGRMNPHIHNIQQMDKTKASACDNNNDDDSDDESIEDISISHNVPMCPPSPAPFSPARTPPMTRRVVGAADRALGGLSSASAQEKRCEQVRSKGLQLDVLTPNTTAKYGSPYTLACAITPSPLHEQTTMATTLAMAGHDDPADDPAITADPHLSSKITGGRHDMVTQLPSQVHDPPCNQQGPSSPNSAMNRSIYDEIQEALIKEVTGEDIQDPPLTSDIDPAQQYPYIHKHMGHLFDKKRLLIGYASSGPSRHRDIYSSPSRSSYSSGRSRHVSGASTVSEAGTSGEENMYVTKVEDRPASDEDEDVIRVTVDDEPYGAASATVMYGQKRRRKNSDGDGSRRHSSSTMSTPYSDLEVTHRGMHRFIPRHADEVQIGIGDPIHVIKEFDDLWCEGVNLRSGERGIFPAMYANDLTFLEESEEEDEHWKFTMRFLGTVEVTSASGDIALCQAINKVAQQGRIKTASLCILEINQYGIRMIDKSKEGHESEKFSNFFALKNISFCGTHPNNNRYFAFITKHPREMRFACHVFHSERSTHRARDALGKAFKRFYQEYMAFTHPTEDIWIE